MINAVLATDAQMNKGVATGTKNVQIYVDSVSFALKLIMPDGTVKHFDVATGTFIV